MYRLSNHSGNTSSGYLSRLFRRQKGFQQVNTPKMIGVLCIFRDLLKKQAAEVLEPAEAQLALAKAAYHDAKIKSNQLLKQAQDIQKMITPQMQAELDEAIEVAAAYEFKSNSELKEPHD
jgi:hypothetical protein